MDFRSFSTGGPVAQPTKPIIQWWTQKGDGVADAVSSVLNLIKRYQERRITQQMIGARLYGNISTMGLGGVSLSAMTASNPGIKDRITYNLVQSVTDTITSKIAKNKPKPLFLTSGGDYVAQRKAKKLNQFMDGVFYENKAHQLGPQIFRDACVWGDGLVHVFAKDGRVKYARVLASELYVDELEGFYGNPRQMHWVKPVDRGQLIEAFPGKRKEIEEATATSSAGWNLPNVADLVTVRESWHLPSGVDARDGKHTLTINGTQLQPMESWEHDFFPFARFSWSKRLWGYWAQSLAEQLQPVQFEINKLLQLVQKSFHLGGSFKILLERNSKIVSEHLTNDVGAVIRYSGTPPQYITPPLVAVEIFQHIQTLIQRGYEQSGVSTLSATSQKPAGLNSGKAIREFNDIESDRFQVTGKDYEHFYLDLARLTVAVIKDSELKGYKVQTPSGKFIQSINWKDIDLDEDQYVMQCFPVSSLPQDPAGRLQTIQEYAQAGYLSPRQARKLLDFPDLEQTESLQQSAEDYISDVLEKIVEHGKYTAPEPFDDLQLGREMALEWYARGKCQGLEEERLEMLRRYMSQIDTLQTMATPAQQPQAAPQAAPEPQPTSDLVQNVPGSPLALKAA